MRKETVIYPLTTIACLLSGLAASLIHRSTKLHFSGDGGGMDELIIYKYMLVSLLICIIAVAFISAEKLTTREVFKRCSLVCMLGVLIIVIFGTLITNLTIHTACDEYGPNSAACLGEKDS